MITIKPDPAHPRGGYAELTIADEQISGQTTEVSVFDNYSERYLGEGGWQATKVMFGPYDVVSKAGGSVVIIGPEIVNQIEEYANVRLTVGGANQDISWPDEIVPAPGAAKIGGILTASAASSEPKGTLTAQMPAAEAPEPERVEEEDPAQAPLEAEPSDGAATATGTPEPAKPASKALLFGGLVLVALLAAAAYWFLVHEKQVPEPEPIAVVPEPEVNAEAINPCGLEKLQALEGFSAQSDALRNCGANVSADTALSLLEQSTSAGDADALALFGTIYDAQASDDKIEDIIGLTFADNPATAAEYYSRAIEAGSEDAKERLAALCDRMSDMQETLVQGAYADYCGS